MFDPLVIFLGLKELPPPIFRAIVYDAPPLPKPLHAMLMVPVLSTLTGFGEGKVPKATEVADALQ
jgi:hypothetical protein